MRRLLPLAALLALAAPAHADHSWIQPSGTLFSGSNNVATFDAAGSEHVFFFDHRPVGLDSIQVWKPDGTPGETTAAMTGRLRSVFDVKLDQPGTWKVASLQTMVVGTFKLDGEERRVGGRGGPPPASGGPGAPATREGGRPAGATATQPPAPGGPAGGGPRRLPPVAVKDIPPEATDVKLTELVTRLETFVTVGEPTTTLFKPTGKGLEMEPLTHPNAVAAGETLRARFLIDGKPAPGLTVTVIPGGDRYREETGTITLTTGADGTVAIRWPAAGMYWLGATATDAHAAEPRAAERRMSYAATIEVATP